MGVENLKIINNPQKENVTYLSFGHSGVIWDVYQKHKTSKNYMWIFSEGKIIIKEETEKKPSHSENFRMQALKLRYSGRYDTNKKIITLCLHGDAMFRDVPKTIISLLIEKFPQAKKMYVFK